MKTAILKASISATEKRDITIKLHKADLQKFEQAYHGVVNCAQYKREIRGTHGVDEQQYTSMLLYGTVRNVTDEERTEFYALNADLPAVITYANEQGVRAKLQAFFEKWVMVEDGRKTQEARNAEVEADRIENEKRKAEEKAELERKIAEGYMQVPEGKMAVILKACQDKSDSRSDYFEPHGYYKHIEDRICLIVPKQAKTEALARLALSIAVKANEKVAKVADTFTWHTENWSMGHGNYLNSARLTDEATGDNFHWEVIFDSYSGSKWIKPIEGFGEQTESKPTTAGGVTVRKNDAHQGIEILFAAKPEREVIENMKAQGFRWSFRQKLWYAKQSERRMAFAESLVA